MPFHPVHLIFQGHLDKGIDLVPERPAALQLGVEFRLEFRTFLLINVIFQNLFQINELSGKIIFVA